MVEPNEKPKPKDDFTGLTANSSNILPRQDSLRNVNFLRINAATVDEFCRSHEGNRPIKKVLIANNGIAAVKFIRSIRSWTYETFRDQNAVKFVCMVTPEDRQANAEFIKMSDKIETVPGGSNQYNYANVDLILDVAVRTKVDAVWAGWGHASENPKLPEILAKQNIIFIGPPHDAMWCLGDKVASTIFAQTAAVPTLPWSGSGLKLSGWQQPEAHRLQEQSTAAVATINEETATTPAAVVWTAGGEPSTAEPDQSSSSIRRQIQSLPEDMYYSACVNNATEALEKATAIGFPIMIKASEGGGGKGIRKASGSENFQSLFAQVQNEVQGSPVFLMKCAEHARHLEVQLLADQYGQAISLFGRDCSVQRRHQKILEEAPVIVAPEDVFEQMEKAAIRLAQMVGYVSAGTVEYLYDIKSQKFFFLELNPRLQVEHPCTEVVCDVNLPACQVQIAMGIPLHRIKDIRRLYKQPVNGTNLIDFTDPNNKPRPNGHVIAVRINSENPDEGFKPSPGTMDELNFKSNRSVWGYFSVGSVGGIHEYSDSQFGHCFSFAENREKARENMVLTLKEMSIRGDFRTTVEYLIRILESENYVTNDIDTGWLDYLIMQKVEVTEAMDSTLAAMCVAIHIGDQKLNRSFQTYQLLIERRQVSKSQKLTNIVDVVLIQNHVKYTMKVCKTGPIAFHLIMNDQSVEAEVHRLLDGCLLVTYDNTSYTTYCKEEIYGFRLIIDNHTITFDKESDPSVLVSPSTGKLVRYIVEDGGYVFAGSVYAYMEVMKLTMELRTAASGCIHYIKRSGAILDAGCQVATLTLDDPGQIRQAEPYTGDFYVSAQQVSTVDKLNQVCEKAYRELEQILDGFCLPEPFFEPRLQNTVNQLMTCLRDPRLPLVELQELMSQISGRIPNSVERCIKQQMSMYASNVTSVLCQFPSSKILHILSSATASPSSNPEGASTNSLNGGSNLSLSRLSLPTADHDNYLLITQPIFSLVQKYERGVRGYMKTVVEQLFEKYYQVEKEFQEGHLDKCLSRLIEQSSRMGHTISGGGGGSPPGGVGVRIADSGPKPRVLSVVFSHQNVATKNQLVLLLIDHLVRNESGLIKDLHDSLTNFTTLNRAENARVSLRARQVLIAAQNPAYEVRHNQVESIFLSAIDRYGHQFRPENLERLILSETVVFDIIFDFFYHSNPKVVSAALEVYVRRAYIAYELTCVHQCQLSNDGLIVEFRFLLPSSHPDRNIQTIYRPKTSSFPFAMKSLANTPSSESLESNPESPVAHERMRAGANSLNLNSEHITGPPRFSLPLENEVTSKLEMHSPPCQRMGLMAAFRSLAEFEQLFDEIMERFNFINEDSGTSNTVVVFQDPPYCSMNPREEPIHIMNVALREETSYEDDALERILEDLCHQKQSQLLDRGIRRVTFLISNDGTFPRYFTFRAKNNFTEDRIYRHLEPALAFQLEINRMRNYELELIPVVNRRMHLYLAKAKVSAGHEITDYRFFVRSIIRHADLVTKEASFEYVTNEAERTLLESLDALELAAMTHPEAHRTNCNHIFLNFAPTLTLPDLARLEETVRGMVMRYGGRLWKLRVNQAELKMMIRFTDQGQRIPIRMWLANEGGYELDICVYKEVLNPDSGQIHFKSFGGNGIAVSSGGTGQTMRRGKLHGMLLETPYQTKDHLQLKRFQAIKFNTTYVYDYPKLVQQALEGLWAERDPGFVTRQQSLQRQLVTCHELVLTDPEGPNPGLKEVQQMPGANTIGMVAWRLRLLTPEFPESGREIILICNDVTFQMGSFSILEDLLFVKASQLARKLGIPRVYFSSNCGARIGLAEEIKNIFRVAWNDPNDEEKGYKYLYLTPADYRQMSSLNNVACEMIEDDGDTRYRITDIIGKEDGIGVENLRASGMIAGETSLAYDEVVTLSLVSARSVGIGAYLVRLGSRVVQVDSSHIILTGAAALNKVLGSEVYSSNNQLGGVQIMAPNGVTHTVVSDELRGIEAILTWLSYVPAQRGGELPVLMTDDPVDRPVSYYPPSNPGAADPRLMLTGGVDAASGEWQSGLLDRGSFIEVLADWARSAVVGRGRLGGVPLAVVTAETRTTTAEEPADPAQPASEFRATQQAGQVWFPCSAFKTAQAMRDFNREGLPLLILANWRGFSGGMKDMHDQVLKFGAHIVDELARYHQPVLVYIPPHCELRGGAWVVLDPSINQQHMEMFADPDHAHGGVLEPEGIVEIKFREKDLIKTMYRLDHECISLRKELHSMEKKDIEHKSALEKRINVRIKKILPIYQQIAVSFAALHDTPGRMLAKGVVSALIPWRDSRRLLYTRLRRRLLETDLVSLYRAATDTAITNSEPACPASTNNSNQDKPTSDVDAMPTSSDDNGPCTDLSSTQSGIESRTRCLNLAQRLFVEDQGVEKTFQWQQDDSAVVAWLSHQLQSCRDRRHGLVHDTLQCLRRESTLASVRGLIRRTPDMAMNCMMALVQELSPAQISSLAGILQSMSSSPLSSTPAVPVATKSSSSTTP